MRCQEFRRLRPAALAGALADPLREPFREHFVECDRCHDHLGQEGVVDALLALADPPARTSPEDRRFAESLVMGSQGEGGSQGDGRSTFAWAIAALFAVVSLLIGWALLGDEAGSRPDDPTGGDPATVDDDRNRETDDPDDSDDPDDPEDDPNGPPADDGGDTSSSMIFDSYAVTIMTQMLAEECLPGFEVAKPVLLSARAPAAPWTMYGQVDVTDPSASIYEQGRRFGWSRIFEEFEELDRIWITFMRGRYSGRVSMTRDQWKELPESWSGSDAEFCRRFASLGNPHRIELGAPPHDLSAIVSLLSSGEPDLPRAFRRYFDRHPIPVDEVLTHRGEPRRILAARAAVDGTVFYVVGKPPESEPREAWTDPTGRVRIEVWTE